ncbi:MAG: hypothetical protein U1F27_17010 [Turneriella sp.]
MSSKNKNREDRVLQLEFHAGGYENYQEQGQSATSTPRITPPRPKPKTISHSGIGDTMISSIFFEFRAEERARTYVAV